ncbi:hypothetical protein CLOM_g16769 [Closterium sp. NIES-68]|nr:hypothetical protein CLOM_g16769 [Closterium sp. NIES-68]
MAQAVSGSSSVVSQFAVTAADVSTHLRKGPVVATWHATAADGVAARASALPALRARQATRGASLRARASTPVDYDSSQEAAETDADDAASTDLTIDGILKQAADAYLSEDEAAVASVEAQIRAMEADRQGLAERLDSLTAEALLPLDILFAPLPWRPWRGARGAPEAEASVEAHN